MRANKKTALQQQGCNSNTKNAINALRTVAAFEKYAGGIFLAATAVAVPRGPAGAKRKKRNIKNSPATTGL